MATTSDRPNATSPTLRPEHLAAAAALAARAPRIAVRPAALRLETDPTGRASSQFLLLNEGHGLLHGTVVSRPPWLRLNVYRFVGNRLQVYLHVDPLHLTEDGEVTGTVVIESNGGTAAVTITCAVKLLCLGENQTPRALPWDHPPLRPVELQTEQTVTPAPVKAPLYRLRRPQRLLMGFLLAGMAGLLFLIGVISNGGKGDYTAEAASLASQPPSFSIGR